ncbi:MAG: Na-translocating system protein MpsB, partial [Methylococcales bacterium]|nr:Na-translocating system protein MpsB [Methylococcales bacterium]
MQESPLKSAGSREQIIAALNQLDQVLSGQAPILDFVHHNPLHGFQHLPFEEALAAFETLTGISAYLPETQSRLFYQQGRINDCDLDAALEKYPDLQAEQTVCAIKDRLITRKDIYRIALCFDLQGITISQLNWQIEELGALDAVQADVPESARYRLFAEDAQQRSIIKRLWENLLTKLDIQQAALHPEALLDLSLEQAEQWLATHQEMRSQAEVFQSNASTALDELLSRIGDSITFRGFVLALSGIDILDSVRPQLIRICASVMDEGVAPWNMPERSRLGLYSGWRATAGYDANPFLHELPDWQLIMSELPEDAVDAIILQLTQLEIPQPHWEGYLRGLALELPGWSGLVNWRQRHPHYSPVNDAAPQLADYVAIRLTLDRLWLNQICRDIWKCEAKLSALRAYFRKNLAEFSVRKSVYQGNLPEYLTQLAESLTVQADSERPDRAGWEQLEDLIGTWQLSPMAENKAGYTVHNSGWRLFRLCQHLGINATNLQALQKTDLQAMLTLLDDFTGAGRSKIWLYAYEHNYRESFFQALRANHNRGRWAKREKTPDSQIIFCMDDREEDFRRHLEELNPGIETLGAAGFFGVAMNYKGLDDGKTTPLCPVVVTPAHEVQEVPRAGSDKTLVSHNRGRRLNQWFANWLHHGLRRSLLLSQPVIDTIAPLTLMGLLAKSLLPKHQNSLLAGMAQRLSPRVKTELMFTSTGNETIASPDCPKPGFIDCEQASCVAGLLRNTGLTYGFSELVVLMGHGSVSQNNPHLAAYDCSACGGRHGGPNARVFAAMANRPEIRKLLAGCGITIPPGTWLIGAEHNSCNEAIS